VDVRPLPHPGEAEVIGCRGLTKRYGDAFAIREIDLSVHEGEVFGFLGPNGAGKTTTLRILLGLIKPTTGTAWMNGRAVPDPRGLSEVGALVEEPAFYPWLSGIANLRVLSRVGAPLSRAAMADAVERAGIATAARAKVATYSQGMRQRLGLAAALMRRPRVLLLDEPTNGLDPIGIRDLRSLLREVSEERTTVFLSSHLLTEVEHLCDRVAIVNRGRLAAVGSLDELGRDVPIVRVTVDPADEARALEILGHLAPQHAAEGGLRVPASSGRQIAELLGRGGVYPEALSVERPSLEDLFLRLTDQGGPRASPGV
jgi:ABC-2 type transport system ATP-binding protein